MQLEDRDFPEIPGELMPDNVAHELQRQINILVGKKGSDFVGSQPVSFQAKHIAENLKRKDYFVCEKTDGLRCLMFCLLDPNNDEAVFLITRQNEFYRVPNFHFPLPDDENSCHNGTLVDGELVISKRPHDGVKELRYFMFDCLAVNGKSIVSRSLDKRLGYLDVQFFKPYYKLRQKHPKECEIFPFKLTLKNMSLPYKLSGVFANLKNLGHVSDGLIFTCRETPYVFGTDRTLLKWKPSEENTIDFKLHLNIPIFIDEELDERDPDRSYPNYDVKPGFELHVWEGKENYSYFAELNVTDEEWDKLKNLNEPLEERIIECNQDEAQNWRLLRFRDDKDNGNFSSTVTKVLQSIRDAVTKEELIEISPDIQQAWKQREFDRKTGHVNNHQPPQPQQHKPQQQSHHESVQKDQGTWDLRKRHSEEDDIPTYNDDDDDDDDSVSSNNENGDDNDNNDQQTTKKPRIE